MVGIFKGILNKNTKHSRYRSPTSEELRIAKDNLIKTGRNASFGELGGVRPEKKNHFKSWWGGNFIGSENEKVPVCQDSGRKMHPVLQIRMDELPFVPRVLSDAAYLTLWFDLEACAVFEASNGHSFEIRTYHSSTNLVPIGPKYREHKTFPTFPVRWHGLEGDLPDWEAFDGAPEMVIHSDDDDWFYDNPVRDKCAELQKTMPVKVGGHDQWWQSPQSVDEGEYAFFLDSTQKGRFGFPGGGNGNFFRTTNGWELRVDCP